MRKDILLPGAALAGGVLGFGLRRWQLASAYVPDTQLFIHRAPATLALLAVMALLLVLTLALVRGKGSGPRDFLPAFRCPSSGFMAVMATAGFLLLGAGGLGLLKGFDTLSLWRNYPGTVQLALPLVMLLCGFLSLVSGLGLLMVGKSCYRDTLAPAACALASFPGLSAVAWMLVVHLSHGTDPVLMRYGFLLAASALLALAHYDAVSFLFDRCRPRRLVLCSVMGTVLGITALADRPALPHILLILGLSLSALALSAALLRNSFGPAWASSFDRMPRGAEEEEDNSADIDKEI